jgi:hypothetical protein
MKPNLLRWSLPPLLSAGALLTGLTPVAAAESAGTDDWQYAATLYLWGAGIDGKTARGSEVNVNFKTLIENLNMAFMGAFEARKGKWSMLADVIYLNVGANNGAKVPVPVAPGSGIDVAVNASVETKGWVLDFIGGYNLWQTPGASLDVLAGARYLDLKLDFSLGLAAGPYTRQRDRSASDSVWDGVIGVKGHFDLNPDVFVPYYADVGTGQSDLTWQASTGLAYRFNWGDVSLLYRYIKWEFGSGSPVDNISFGGPLLAARFVF